MCLSSNLASKASWYPDLQNHLFSFPESGGFFVLVEAPAPSPGEQYLFWYAVRRTAATRSKITNDRKTRSPPIRAAISHLLQTGQAAILCNFYRGYQRVLRRISVPVPFAVLLPVGLHRKHLRYQRGKQKEVAHTQIIPTAQHILESYSFLSLEEKNRLWKLVLKKVTIYRSPDDEITIRLHPNLPK